jgi:hypothetical protein
MRTVARPGRPVPAAQRGCAHGVVTASEVLSVARLMGARRWPRRDEVRTLNIGVVRHGGRARWWGRGCTVAMGHRRGGGTWFGR